MASMIARVYVVIGYSIKEISGTVTTGERLSFPYLDRGDDVLHIHTMMSYHVDGLL